MNFNRARHWPILLCIGIVITGMVAWWVARPELEVKSTQAARQQATRGGAVSSKLSPKSKTEKKPPNLMAVPESSRPVSLNAFEQRLLQDATLLEKRRIEARENEPARELKLWRTDFKYPMIREEVWLRADEQGRQLPVRREFSVADHAMVKFPAEVTEKQIADWAKRNGFYVRHRLQTTPVRLIAMANGTLDSAGVIMAAFRKTFPQAQQTQAAMAERDYLVFPTLFPDDTSFSQLWGMHNTGQTGGTADADIDAPEAWDISTGSREVLVGVIDTGVDRTHPDLVANMWTNPNEIVGNGIDDDGNGFVDDANGWDFFSNDNNPMDENNHGTHCSGTIGGVGNNLNGVTGVCWQVSIVGIRFLGPSGGSTSDAIECVNYATGLGVDLTSNSWGGGGSSALLQAAIADAGAANQLFIAAAGNDSSNTDASPQYPAGYPLDNIISVASSTDRDARSSFSNYGALSVDLAAPGSSVYSTIIGGSYSSFSGTSMATPHVSGAVALLKSIAPLMTAAEIKAQLLDTVDALPAFATTTVSGGRLNVARLIEQSAGPRPVVSVTTIQEQPGGNGDGIYNPGETLALRFTVVNRGSETAQNVTATLASSAITSRFTITQGTVTVGTMAAGETVASAPAFLVQSQANTPTPYAEEFIITLHYGVPAQQTAHRVTLYLHISSRIQGRITDAGDAAPIAGAAIRLAGPSLFTTTSGSDGTYAMTVTDGVYSITAAAPGYVTSAPTLVTTPPDHSNVNFALGIPQLGLTPSAVIETVYSGRSSTRTVELRNRGTAPLRWSQELLNGHVTGSSALRLYSLPAATVMEQPELQDGGLRAAFKTSQVLEVPALEAPLGTLDGLVVGAVSTTWDRSVLIGDLVARGAQVVTLTLPLTVAALDAVDSVIVDDAIASFSTTDMSRLRLRVSAGAGVLCEADNSGSITMINQLFASTGVTAVYDGFRDMTLTDIRSHPMTLGVTTVQAVAAGASATISGTALPLVMDPNGRAHAAVTSLGLGVLVFVGNEISDDSNYITGDARLLANQIVDGLIARPKWLTASPASGILVPGAAQTLTLGMSTDGLTAGTYEATVLFTTNVPDAPETSLPVTMYVGDASQLSLNRSALAFGSVVVGVAAEQVISISSVGTLPLNVSNMRLQGPDASFFSIAGESAFQILRGGSRSVTVSFASTAPLRDYAAELVIESDDPTAPTVIVPITGTRQVAPDIVVTPVAPIITLNQGQTGFLNMTLENKGLGPLDWQAALALSGSGGGPTWASVLGVAGRINAKARGLIRINFDTGLLSPGDHTTELHITSQDIDTPHVTIIVTMRVKAVARPQFTLSSTFADTILGTRRQISVPIQNIGAANLVLSSKLSLSAAFVCLTPTPLTIPGGETRSLIFEFRPTKAGAVASSVLFASNVSGRYLYFNFSGKGIRSPTLQLTPASIALSTPPGANHVRTLKLTNAGDLPLIWTPSVENAGTWLTLADPGGTLAPSQSHNLPLGINTELLLPGIHKAQIILTSNDIARPRVSVPITITVSRLGVLAFTPATLRFDEAWANRLEVASFVCANTGNAPIQVLSIASSNNRMILPTASWPFTLEPGTQKTVDYYFSSSVAGEFTDRFTIKTSLNKTGLILPVISKVVRPPAIAVAPGLLDEDLEPGESVTRDLTITNDGQAALTWTNSLLEVTGTPSSWITLDKDTGTTAAGGSSVVSVTLSTASLAAGTQTAKLRFNSNALSLSQVDVPVTFRVASAAVIRPTPALLAFPQTYTQTTSSLDCTISNPGNLPLIITEMISSESAFTTAGITLPLTLNPGASAVITVRFTPMEVRDHNATLTLKSNARSAPDKIIPLSGRAVIAPHIVVAPTSVTLTVEPGVIQASTLTLSNTGGVPLQWTAASSGAIASLTSLSAASGTTTAGGSSPLTLTVTSTLSTAAGASSGQITFTSNDPSRPSLVVPVVITIAPRPRLTITPTPLSFTDTFYGSIAQSPISLRNDGNATLSLTGISSDSARFDIVPITLPATIAAGATRTLTVRFLPNAAASFSGQLSFSTNPVLPSPVLLPLSGRGITPPILRVAPGALTLSLEKGRTSSQPLTISNDGGSTLSWQAAITNTSTGSGTLQEVLQRVNDNHAALTALIPNVYSFTEGVTGTSITDGGGDMYDTGNFLDTSLGSGLAYSNNAVTTSASVGTGGSYFTFKQNGLFVFAADLNGVSSFAIRGNLGADGSGITNGAVLTRIVGGITYKGFFKGVSGALDPSVNHLIIVEDKPGVSHTYSTNTDNDAHSVSGLSGTVRLYYLLFARQTGAQVSDVLAGNIMDSFLQNMGLSANSPWISVSPASGNTAAGASSTANVQLDTRTLPVGTHSATIRVTSNAPVSGTANIPLSVEVTEAELDVTPSVITALQLADSSTASSALTLTARAGTNPAWTASPTVPWITLSKTSGTGSDSLTLTYSSTLAAGSYQGAVNINYNGLTLSVPVSLTVRTPNFSQLLTDYRQSRVLGIIRGTGGEPSVLASVNTTTLAVDSMLLLPTDITDADVTTDGRQLYAISFAGKTITQVDLDTFTLVSTKTIPAALDAGSYHYHVETGRPGLVYYTDAATNPALHVFNYDAGIELQSFVLNSGAGIGDFVVTPDGNTIYAWSQSGWGTSGTSLLVRINSASDTLSQTSLSTDTVSQSPLEAPVFYSASRDAVITKGSRFNPTLTTRQSYLGQTIIAASAHGHVLVSGSSVLDGTTGAALQTLPVSVTVAAFTGDQTALVYLNNSTQRIARVAVPNLPPASITPLIADGGTLAAAPAALSWTGSPTSASYDVFLGTDAAALNAATNSTAGIYRGNTAGVSLSFSGSNFQLGQTYYWRIDTRNFDGSTVKGTVWSFRLPPVAVTPASLTMATLVGSTSSVTTTLSITTAAGDTPWTLSDNAAWLSVDTPTGSGPATVTASFNPSGLTAGNQLAQITLTSGTDTITVPVTFRLLGTLNIIKLEADPTLPFIYALHRDLASPFEGWLLWIDPITARVEQAVLTDTDATDLAVHVTDDRIYTLTNGGTRVVAVQRQQARQVVGALNLSTSAVVIHNGPVGRLVARSATNVLQMYNSGTGGLIGSSVSLPACITRTPSAGNFLYAAVQQSSGVTGIAKYGLSSSGIIYSTASYWNGILGSSFVVSGDGSRAFYNLKAYSTTAFAEIATLGAGIVAASWNGQMAFSNSKIYSVSATPQELATLPAATVFMAATASNSRLVLYEPVNRALSSMDLGTLVASATMTTETKGAQPLSWPPPASYLDLVLSQITANLDVPNNMESAQTPVMPATGLTLDLDKDGKPDVWTTHLVVSSKAGAVTTHHFTYSRRAGLSDTAVTLQASRDGTTWSDLSLGLEYMVESVVVDKELNRETVILSIPTASDIPWQFRLISAP